jgi:flagellar M-ring protein FliF
VIKDSSTLSDGVSASENLLSYQQQVEKRLESRIQPLLDRILGNNRAIVKIGAELDFARTQKTLEFFDPAEPVVKSEHFVDEPAGVSGTGKSESTITYEVSKTTSIITDPVGRIKRLTVSILVDPSVVSDTIDAAEPNLDEAMLQAIEKMLSGTISFNAQRGDQLHLVTVPLGRLDDIPATFESVPSNLLYDYLPAAKYGLVLIGFILLYFLLIRPTIRALTSEYDRHHRIEEHEHPDVFTYKSEQEPEREYTVHVQEEVLQNPSPAAHIIRKWIQDT